MKKALDYVNGFKLVSFLHIYLLFYCRK